MKLHDMLTELRQAEVFDLQMLEVLSGQNRNVLRVQLHRWISDNKITALRRGLYTLSEGLAGSRQGARLANLMVRPSYLTGLWALSFYGLIPEAVHEFTSATTTYKQIYENAFGRFSYRRLKADAFRGWNEIEYGDTRIRLATPAKAVLDHLYWTPGDPIQIMNVLRFQPEDVTVFSWESLSTYAAAWGSPRLVRFAAKAPAEFCGDWEEI
ncbi:MAG: hypothetical protein JXR40_00580 [Pontiellaceae bacterium]|nr:hypothetical protein [Pontiellaceae bacterium]